MQQGTKRCLTYIEYRYDKLYIKNSFHCFQSILYKTCRLITTHREYNIKLWGACSVNTVFLHPRMLQVSGLNRLHAMYKYDDLGRVRMSHCPFRCSGPGYTLFFQNWAESWKIQCAGIYSGHEFNSLEQTGYQPLSIDYRNDVIVFVQSLGSFMVLTSIKSTRMYYFFQTRVSG